MSQQPNSPLSICSMLYYWFFDTTNSSGFAKLVEKAIAWLIVLSVFSIVLEHIPEVQALYLGELHVFDIIAVSIFTIEYLLRWFTAPNNPDYANFKYPRLRHLVGIYAVVDLVAIAPFYIALFMTVDVELLRALRLFRLFRMFKFSRLLIPAVGEFLELNKKNTFRQKIYALLEPTDQSGKLQIYFDNFIVFWVAVSIICVLIESVNSIHQVFYLLFQWVDVVTFTIFTVEYLARLYVAPENPAFNQFKWKRLGYAKSNQALIDLVTILPFILEAIITYQVDLRFLRVFRLMRLLKLTRYSSATQTLGGVLKREKPIILSAMFVLFLLILLTASLGYLLEHDAQPDVFTNIPQSIYWAMTTLSSVGYGDMTPVTPLGRMMTSVVALIGVGIFAIPAGVLASAFTDQLQQDREALKRKVAKIFATGTLDQESLLEINKEAERLHISTSSRQRIMDEAEREYKESQAGKAQFSGLIINVLDHPEYASQQFQTLIDQLLFLITASEAQNLQLDLSRQYGSDSDELKIFNLLSPQSIAS